MKVNQLLAIGGIAAALVLSAGNVLAQNGNGGGGGGGGGGGFRNMDPAQMQQRMLDNIKDEFGYTNDTEWSAVQPLFVKVMEARRDVGFGGGMGRLFRPRNNNNGGNNGGGNNRRGGFGGTPSPETEALQKAIDDNAPAAQIKDLFAKFKAAQKAKQAKLLTAQENLRKVLTPKQEAQATLAGLLE